MKKLIALWIALKAIEHEVALDAHRTVYYDHYYDNPRRIGKTAAYIEAWVEFLSWQVKSTMCSWFGHKWVDDSSCGPESGDMDMYCERCGHTFHHTLY